MKPLNSALTLCSSVLLMASPALAVEYETTSDYVAISFEAEEYDSKDDRWVLTNASTGQLPADEDPDGNHSDTASGGVYFEVLPDIRVTHEDPGGPPQAFWNDAGYGPEMSWTINVPEAGRYVVHASAFSTGTEDNGMHVGLNGNWPNSGERLQFCAKNRWVWSSAKRDSGGVGSCGVQNTIYLDIDSAGTHEFNLSAREDGFEIDRFVLIKDKTNNTKTCMPENNGNITCTGGGVDSSDDETDLSVSLKTTPSSISNGSEEASPGTTFTVTAMLENEDGFDDAEDVVATIEFSDGLDVASRPDGCSAQGQTIMCSLSRLRPTGPDEDHSFAFNVEVLDSNGTDQSIEVEVENSLIETDYGNNSDSLTIRVAEVDLSTDVGVELSLVRESGGDDLLWTVGELGALNLAVSNDSEQDAGSVDVQIELSNGVSVDLLPPECSGTETIICSFDDLAAGDSRNLSIEISAASEGTQIMSASVTAANDVDVSNDKDAVIAAFEEETVVIDEEPIAGGDDNEIPTTVTTPADLGLGAMNWQALLALLLVVSAGVYWRHQRQPIPVRNALRSDGRSNHQGVVKHDQ